MVRDTYMARKTHAHERHMGLSSCKFTVHSDCWSDIQLELFVLNEILFAGWVSKREVYPRYVQSFISSLYFTWRILYGMCWIERCGWGNFKNSRTCHRPFFTICSKPKVFKTRSEYKPNYTTYLTPFTSGTTKDIASVILQYITICHTHKMRFVQLHFSGSKIPQPQRVNFGCGSIRQPSRKHGNV